MLNSSTALQLVPEARIFDRGWRYFMDLLVQDVPQSIAACEFDCRKTNCTPEEWQFCERRLRGVRRERE